MKYLLVVGFNCEVYQQEPLTRIYINNNLIDEFNILENKNNLQSIFDNYFDLNQNKDFLKPFSHVNDFLPLQIKNLPPLRFYEIDVDPREELLQIRINIDNNDSNYNNGFMTKSTLLKLQVLYFFPYDQKILSYFNAIKTKNRIGTNYAWYKRYKNMLFDIVRHSTWYGKNEQIIDSSKKKILEFHNIGGEGYINCNLVKKYGIYIPKLVKSNRYDIDFSFLKYLYDKYQQHENQRNTD
jgi:hypothetical protein